MMTPEIRTELELTMRREEKLLGRWITKKLGDRDAADDVVQSVFMRVWAFAENNKIENPRALMFKAAANLAYNEIKRRNRFNRRHIVQNDNSKDDFLSSIASGEPSPEQQASLREDVTITLNAINSLPENSRRAFKMNRFDGLSYKEIALALNVSTSSVEKYMIQALKVLRAELSAQRQSSSKVVRLQPRAALREKG